MATGARIGAALGAALLLAMRAMAGGAQSDWQERARQIHARFTGHPGTLLQLGDSITYSQAFWTPLETLPENAPPAMKHWRAAISGEAWRGGKGAAFGSESGKTVAWARERVEGWLARANPEVAVVLLGSNDVTRIEVDAFRRDLDALLARLEANGTVPILTTLPPRHGLEQKTAAFAQAARELAAARRLPLIDYHAQILRRRPADWDGALPEFAGHDEYEVPTLLARDGVHPSFPARFRNDYSETGLRSSGYTLRNYLTLKAVAEVAAALQNAPRPPVRFPDPTPLPLPAGEVVRVEDVATLRAACATARPGQTILLADGHYPLDDFLEIKVDRVTLRGESGRPERVVLDGGGTLGELLKLTACADVTLADFTVENVRWNGIKINSETGVQRLRIFHCILHNIWQRAVKGVKVPAENRARLRPTGFSIEHCLFVNDRPKRFEDDPADTAQNYGGDYIGGIDAMWPTDWTIRANVFVGIQGRRRQARGAVFLWHEAQGCRVEDNVFLDCDAGVCLGNSSKPDDVAIHATDCVVEDNLVVGARENGILADFTRNCRIVGNRVVEPNSELGRLIRTVHDNDGLRVEDNLLVGPAPRNESASAIRFAGNLDNVPASHFVAPERGDLRLAPAGEAALWRTVHADDVTSFRQAVAQATPGTRLLLAPGTYRGRFDFNDVRGAPGRPITIAAADPKNPPVFVGAGECLHFVRPRHLVLEDLTLKGATDNGLNLDDGADYVHPARHIALRRIRVSDIGPEGNHDGIKLSGIDDFVVEDCVVERCSGSAIDMVGCHRGRFVGCRFRDGGHSGIQIKGGSSQIQIARCRFERYGERAVNIGGSTGMAFFRPPVASMPPDGRYEARDIRVEESEFLDGVTPFAFVGVDGALIRRNRVQNPRWALRILQETTEPGFVPCRNGVFEENVIVFSSATWAEGGVNIGPNTAPQTFRFARNHWYCEDVPARSRPNLPTPESDGVVGVKPADAPSTGRNARRSTPSANRPSGAGTHARHSGPRPESTRGRPRGTSVKRRRFLAVERDNARREPTCTCSR